jgi:hypothetical protein
MKTLRSFETSASICQLTRREVTRILTFRIIALLVYLSIQITLDGTLNLELAGNKMARTVWGKWNSMGQVERYGASGMLWGKWNVMGQVERYGASGMVWGKWNGMGHVDRFYGCGSLLRRTAISLFSTHRSSELCHT